MATRTISIVGGNYNSTLAWTEAAVPTSADSVVATSLSNQLTVNVASAAASIDLTNYTNVVTFNNTLTVSGNVTIPSIGLTLSGASSLIINATSSVSIGPSIPSLQFTGAGSSTFTLLAPIVTVNTLTLGNAAPSVITFAGSFTMSANRLSVNSANATANLSGNIFCGLMQYINTSAAYTLNGFTVSSTGGFSQLSTAQRLQGTTNIYVTGGTISWSGNNTTNLLFNNLEIAGNTFLTGNISYGSGILKFTSGLINTTGATISLLNTSATITNNMIGLTISNLVNFVGSTFNGSNGFTINNYTVTNSGLNLRLTPLNTYNIINSLILQGTLASPINLFSTSVGTQSNFILNSGATQDVSFVNATDINSSAGQTIWDFKPVLSNTLNWNSLTSNRTVVSFGY